MIRMNPAHDTINPAGVSIYKKPEATTVYHLTDYEAFTIELQRKTREGQEAAVRKQAVCPHKRMRVNGQGYDFGYFRCSDCGYEEER